MSDGEESKHQSPFNTIRYAQCRGLLASIHKAYSPAMSSPSVQNPEVQTHQGYSCSYLCYHQRLHQTEVLLEESMDGGFMCIAEAALAVAWWQSGMAPSGTLVTCCGETAAIFSQVLVVHVGCPNLLSGGDLEHDFLRLLWENDQKRSHGAATATVQKVFPLQNSLAKTPDVPSTTSQTPRHPPLGCPHHKATQARGTPTRRSGET